MNRSDLLYTDDIVDIFSHSRLTSSEMTIHCCCDVVLSYVTDSKTLLYAS